MTEDLVDSLMIELRRGTLVLTVLSQLEEKQYGYSLKQALLEQGLDIDQGTLYPLLRRLESQGLLDSEWSLETSRPRRYYVLNAAGHKMLEALEKEWDTYSRVIEHVLGKDEK